MSGRLPGVRGRSPGSGRPGSSGPGSSGRLQQLNGRLTQLAVGPHLSYRAVRTRLTLMYGALFLISGAALMAIAYGLLINAGFVFTLPASSPPNHTTSVLRGPVPAVSQTTPSAATMTHWRDVAQCMREHGVHDFPNPLASTPARLFKSGSVSLGELPPRQIDTRDGVIFVMPGAIDQQSRAFLRASTRCRFSPDALRTIATDDQRRAQVRDQLLLQSGIALAGMSLLSLALGWLMAGRVLQPLEAAHEAQRQFVANASHELRAPLTRQRALIQVALADPDADATSLRAAHERALAAEQHLEQMIDALLALTRGQAGLQRHERVDLAAIAGEAMLAYDAELGENGLDLRRNLVATQIQGDPRLLERLIANLVQNAVRHNVPGGWLEVTTGTRQRRPFVAVENTGPVVDQAQIERLFQPFERLATRTGHGGGHGLGLPIVQAVAQAHGAEVAVRPRPDGGLLVEVEFRPRPDQQRRRMAVLSRWLRHANTGAAVGD